MSGASVCAGNPKTGRLWSVGRDAFEGEWYDAQGRKRRRRFEGVTCPEAKMQWQVWRDEMERRQDARIKEDIMAASRETRETRESKAPGAVYVVTVVGGAPIRYAENQDVALAVATALEAAAKASGFAAAYDVVEVQPWAV